MCVCVNIKTKTDLYHVDVIIRFIQHLKNTQRRRSALEPFSIQSARSGKHGTHTRARVRTTVCRSGNICRKSWNVAGALVGAGKEERSPAEVHVQGFSLLPHAADVVDEVGEGENHAQ